MLILNQLDEIITIILISIGISYVLSGSKIGHPFRFAWCFVLDRLHVSYFWSIMTCPPCNSWWVGLAVSLAYGYSVLSSIAAAFATCGCVAAIQAIGLSIGMQAEEDYNELIPRRGEHEEKAHGNEE